MSTTVLMPQMGESIAEGTIVRWIKQVGDHVDRDEPLFEISTDKVDAEIPSPAAGVLREIRVKEGETVPVNSVVATIGEAGEAPDGQEQHVHDAEPAAQAQPQPDGSPSARSAPAAPPGPAGAPAAGVEDATKPPEARASHPSGEDGAPQSKEDARRARSSPLVRKIAREHDVDIRELQGSGVGGRVTKQDILQYIEKGSQKPPAPPAGHVPSYRPGEASQVVPLSVMRRKIAEHMVLSKRTSAHVHSVFEVNYSRVAQLRDEKRAEYERAGVKLTYLPFIAMAVVHALRQMPIVNSSLDGDNVVYRKDVNLGIAVALEAGLIVPVVRQADEKNLLGLARAIGDVATRARSKQLKPEEVQGGTFTITNPGGFGAQFGMPIINQPQVAILGVGTIEKRAVVIDDAIAIRPMGYLTLGYDHRLIDGATGDQFMARIKHELEHFDSASV